MEFVNRIPKKYAIIKSNQSNPWQSPKNWKNGVVEMEQKDGRSAMVVVVAGAVVLLGAVLLSPPMFQFGYQPVNPSPVTGVQLVRVDLNKASEAALRSLPGVGEKRAAAILQYRESHGAFERIEDIVKVEGFSEEDLEELRPYLYIQ